MANTVKDAKTTIELTDIDEDYAFNGQLTSVKFYPGAVDDVVIFKDTYLQAVELDQPVKIRLESDDGKPQIEYFFGEKVRINLDFSASTITAGSMVLINMASQTTRDTSNSFS